GALPDAIKDRYVIETARFAALFGIPEALRPASYAAHAAYMREMLASNRIAVAPCAREMASFLVGRGAARQPWLGRLAESVTAFLLPPPLAAEFELRATPLRARAGLGAVSLVYRRVPDRMRRIPSRSQAQRRIRGQPPSRIQAWLERGLFELARRATGTRPR
ncbi:MAG TPA: oxygenase MpaB family protein, partial [Kofleriaceae bacterium]|nr:oxygenase MpaB family protein [Kofleriaceae bacterium]